MHSVARDAIAAANVRRQPTGKALSEYPLAKIPRGGRELAPLGVFADVVTTREGDQQAPTASVGFALVLRLLRSAKHLFFAAAAAEQGAQGPK